MPLNRLPSLGALRAFEAAARLGSFRAAAEELSVTAAAISQQVRALEEDLGVALFDRDPRGVTPTVIGSELQTDLTSAFLQIRNGVDRARKGGASAIRLESSGPIVSKWVLPRLIRFTERHPDVSLSLLASMSVATLASEGPDVVIRFTRTPGRGLHARKLFDEHLVPLAHPEFIERMEIRDPADLLRVRLLHDGSFEVFGDTPDWRTWFAQNGVDASQARAGVQFDRGSADHSIEAAANGMGVVLGRVFLAQDEIEAGRLVPIFGPAMPMHVSYFLLCQEGREREPHVAAVLNWIESEVDAEALHALVRG